MYRHSYVCKTRTEQYKNAEPDNLAEDRPGTLSLAELRSLRELVSGHIQRARALEQRQAVLLRQLDNLQLLGEPSHWEDTLTRHAEDNLQLVGDLETEPTQLELKGTEAQCALDEFQSKYENECECNQLLTEMLKKLNKKMEKNLLEIKTYVSILQYITQTTPQAFTFTGGINKEKSLTEQVVAVLQCELEESQELLSILQVQRAELQTQTETLDQAITDAHECYDNEMQLYDEQIDSLQKEIEEIDWILETSSYNCRQLLDAQQTLKNDIENENHRCGQRRAVERVLGLFILNVSMKKEITVEHKIEDSLQDTKQTQVVLKEEFKSKFEFSGEESSLPIAEESLEDVPDGGQISKAFGKLCNMVKEKVRVPQSFDKSSMVFFREDDSMHYGSCRDSSTEQLQLFLEKGEPQERKNEYSLSQHSADKKMELSAQEHKGHRMKYTTQKEDEDSERPSLVITLGPEEAFQSEGSGGKDEFEGHELEKSCMLERRSPQTLACEKVKVVESIEKVSTECIQSYKETTCSCGDHG
ncbi:filensin [Suncus etruscus]|uniref:filensin n=1 Tax=Suncus etruscus TaxID=109475 RepID=UPI0021103A76|nr:filensin [Suncus etruscus]